MRRAGRVRRSTCSDVARTEQRYLRNTAILETLLHDAHGGVAAHHRLRPRFRARGRFFRPMMFVRIVEPVAGRPALRMRLRPLGDYGERASPARTRQQPRALRAPTG